MSWFDEMQQEFHQKRANTVPTNPTKAPSVSFVGTDQVRSEQKTQNRERELVARFCQLVRSRGVDEGIYIETGKALAMLRPDSREEIQNGTADLDRRRTLATQIAQRVVQERGNMIPVGWESMVLCEQCGPVWWTTDMAPAVSVCPWCDIRRAGKWFLRPEVKCGECRHFTRDRTNPPGGLGVCQVDAPLAGLCFPHSRKQCPAWQPLETAPVDDNVRTEVRTSNENDDPTAAI